MSLEILAGAVMALVASGFVMAVYFAVVLREARDEIRRLQDRVGASDRRAYELEDMLRGVALAAGLEWRPPERGGWRRKA